MNILEKSIRVIGGVFNERLLAYFKNYGATSNVLQDAEKEYLRGKGLTFGANQDAWKQLDGQYEDIIPLEVSDILKKYNATMLLPGVSGALRFGYQPGNYRESTGQTLAAVDQQVGLVVDAAQVPGEELLPAWSAGFSSLTNIGIGASAGTVNLVGAEIVMVSGDGSADRAEFTIGGLVAGRLYQARVTARRGSQGTSQNFSSWTVGTINRVSIDSTDNKEYVINFVASGTGGMIRAYAADISGGAIGDAVIVSSISVRELPGIHASQSTSGFQPVLRNTAGIQSWQFDGTDDRLSLSAVPFQMADDHFVVAGAARGGTGISRRLFHVGSAGDVPRVAVLSFSSNGTPELNYRNDAGTLTTISGSAPLGTAPVVISATSISTVINLRAESALLATGTRPSGATTLTAAAVGAHTAGTAYFNGHIHGVIFGKGAISDSELLTLERFVASLQGRQL